MEVILIFILMGVIFLCTLSLTIINILIELINYLEGEDE